MLSFLSASDFPGTDCSLTWGVSLSQVADFGLSKQRRQTYVSGVKPHTGTLPWMAPEILKTPNCVGDKVVVGIALITPPGEQHRFRPYRGRFSALLSHPVPAAFWPTAHVPQADIYSFGIVMWELWTSLEPYAGMHYANLLHQRMTEPNLRPPVPGTPAWEEGSSASPEEPAPGWRQLMESCWSEDPSGRPPFTEIVTRLKEMVDAVKPNRKKATDD